MNRLVSQISQAVAADPLAVFGMSRLAVGHDLVVGFGMSRPVTTDIPVGFGISHLVF